MFNHHLLQIIGKPSWLTIDGGRYDHALFILYLSFLTGSSKLYVNKILKALKSNQIHLSSPVISLKSIKGTDTGRSIILETIDGRKEGFDHVIIACHSDTALEILRRGGVEPEEERILSKFQWNKNEAVLHCDTKVSLNPGTIHIVSDMYQLMPKSRLAWSCWNYLSSSATDDHGFRKANIDEVSLYVYHFVSSIMAHVSFFVSSLRTCACISFQ